MALAEKGGNTPRAVTFRESTRPRVSWSGKRSIPSAVTPARTRERASWNVSIRFATPCLEKHRGQGKEESRSDELRGLGRRPPAPRRAPPPAQCAQRPVGHPPEAPDPDLGQPG